jgi:hypothetical protein
MQESLAGVAQLVERNLAKVEVASSSLVARSIYGAVAQLGERLNGIQEVVSSILIGSTKSKQKGRSAQIDLFAACCPVQSSTVVRRQNEFCCNAAKSKTELEAR